MDGIVTAAEKRALVRRLQAGKRKAKRDRPKRIKEIEKQMDVIERRRKREPEPSVRASLIREIAALGIQRKKLID